MDYQLIFTQEKRNDPILSITIIFYHRCINFKWSISKYLHMCTNVTELFNDCSISKIESYFVTRMQQKKHKNILTDLLCFMNYYQQQYHYTHLNDINQFLYNLTLWDDMIRLHFWSPFIVYSQNIISKLKLCHIGLGQDCNVFIQFICVEIWRNVCFIPFVISKRPYSWYQCWISNQMNG